jgi:hypothetical protein
MRAVLAPVPFALAVALFGTTDARGSQAARMPADAAALSTTTARALLPDPTDACSLLTSAQVGASLGITVGPGSYPVSTKGMCRWTPPGPRGAAELALTVRIIAKTEFDMTKTTARLAKVTPVPGIGDEAYSLTGHNTPVTLFFRHGTFYVRMYVDGMGFHDNPTKSMSALTALAKQILAGT